MTHHLVDENGQPITAETWARLTHDEAYHRVGATTLDGGWHVSTVYIGTNTRPAGPPQMFETMLFDPGGEPVGQWRWESRGEANLGHVVITTMASDEAERSAYLAERDGEIQAVLAELERGDE